MSESEKFALVMPNGTEAQSLEELQQNCNLDAVRKCFEDGTLETWLADRYYEEEADAVEQLARKADSLTGEELGQKLCNMLGVSYIENGMSGRIAERMEEKREILEGLTLDKDILGKSADVAFNQMDLADLLDMGRSVIYLCGDEEFRIPSRVENRTYIGILGRPKVRISLKSASECEEKNIVLENVTLPHGFRTHEREELEQLFIDCFHGKEEDRWEYYDVENEKIVKEASSFTETAKKNCLKRLGAEDYTPEDVIFCCMDKGGSDGYALTYDALVIGGTHFKDLILKYTEEVEQDYFFGFGKGLEVREDDDEEDEDDEYVNHHDLTLYDVPYVKEIMEFLSTERGKYGYHDIKTGVFFRGPGAFPLGF